MRSVPRPNLRLAGLLASLLAAPAFAQVNIPESNALPSASADASRPGFLWNVFQNEANQENTVARAENAIAGLLVDGDGNPLPNLAVPEEVGGASGPGTRLGTAENALVQFVVPTVINFNQDGVSVGNIPDDLTIPGVPGANFSTDGITGEVLTWLDLPVGVHTLIVNSDDGFRLYMGGTAPADRLATVVGEFNAGRGAADTIMRVNITRAGLYATRLIWFEGGGGANVEFVEVKADGTRAAVNAANSTIKAYRAVTGNQPTAVVAASPGPNATGVAFDAPVAIRLSGPSVDANTVRLLIDGTQVSATVNKSGDITSINYTPTARYAPRSRHALAVTFNDGAAREIGWEFTVTDYAVLNATHSVTPDTSKPGFIWRVHQNAAFQANDKVRPEEQLAGRLGLNRADPAAQGTATGTGVAGATPNHPITFEIAGTINLDQESGANGEFQPDDPMPGIPGTGDDNTAPTDGIAAEILTYIEMPVGTHTLIVNSDDGFHTTAGNARDVFDGQLAGQFVGGRGASDTAFRVVVEAAGVYCFRTVWYEGGGGANIEWKMVKADGTRALLNDTANGGFRTYRATTSPVATAVTRVRPAPDSTQNAPNLNFEITIEEGTAAVDTASVRLSIDGGAPVTPTVTKAGNVVTVTYDPPTDFPSLSTHTASLTFAAGGASRTEEWSFSIPAVTRDSVAGHTGFLLGIAAHTSDSGGRTGQAGDYALDFKGSNGSSVYVPDVSFLNAATADNDLTFSHWQKLVAPKNSSAFWVNSPSSNNGTRGWQAHTPWGDSTIYFDTSGCCTADTQRINRNMNVDNFPDFTGAEWWTEWHHYAFVKRADGAKEIWVDGILFHSGLGDPLMTDLTSMYIGAQDAVNNTLNGIMDDLAIYNTALSEAQIKSLAEGAVPTAVTGNPGLLAWWAFNDPPTPSSAVDYSIGLNFGSNEAGGSLAATDRAGVDAVAQVNWNNLAGQNGTNTTIVADVKGTATPTSVTVTWGSNNTWASTGRGEENNMFTGPDRALMTGYLDTGAPTTTTVKVEGLPAGLTSEGYDVYVYTLGGVAGRGGGYRIVDAVSGAVLRDNVRAQSPANPTDYVQVPSGLPTTEWGAGTYLLFSGLNAANISIIGSTADGLGFGSPARAPINAIQLVAPASSAPAPQISIARDGANLVITFTGTLQSASAVNGPYTDVAGATSPRTVAIPATGAGYWRSVNP